jgi:hexosaminidase
VFDFLQGVLDEVLDLFPGKIIHIGVHEVRTEHWRACPACQKRIRNEKLGDENALQGYFVQRITDYLESRGRTAMGRDEMFNGGLPPKAAVMAWMGEAAGIEAALLGHPVVITPWLILFFSNRPVRSQDNSGPGFGFVTDVKSIYDFDPARGFRDEGLSELLGAQGALWTEYVSNQEELEYMLHPRVEALAESTWSPRALLDWRDFERRMRAYRRRLDGMGVNYCSAWLSPCGKALKRR